MSHSTVSLVGATGGAGTTRLAVELGATLARDGRSVAIVDAAFETEGLARHVPDRIETDVTAVVAEDRPLAAGLRNHPASADLRGRLELCPAHAPFERLARAKTAEAARRFEDRIAAAAGEFDHVLVDTPPVAANQAVAAVSATDRVAVVAPASDRGVDALQRTRGRIADVGASVDAVLANRVGARDGRSFPGGDGGRSDEGPVRSADVVVPGSVATSVEDVPASAPDPEDGFGPAVGRAAETVFETSLDLTFEEPGLLDVDAAELLPDALS